MLPFDQLVSVSRRSGYLPDLRLFVLADSISFFYGPYLEQYLAGRFTCDRKGTHLLPTIANVAAGTQISPPPPGRLQRALDLDIETYAVNGGDSICVLDYLRSRPPACDLLLLNCGLHDVRVNPQTGAHQVEPADYARNLEAILALAARIAPRVVWVRTTPVIDDLHNRLNEGFLRYNADVLTYNAIADERVQAAGFPAIDLYNFTISLCRRGEDLRALYQDHVHFTEPVRRQQGAYIAGWLAAAPDPKGLKRPLGSGAGDPHV